MRHINSRGAECYTLIVHSIQGRASHHPGEKWLLIMSPVECTGSTTNQLQRTPADLRYHPISLLHRYLRTN